MCISEKMSLSPLWKVVGNSEGEGERVLKSQSRELNKNFRRKLEFEQHIHFKNKYSNCVHIK